MVNIKQLMSGVLIGGIVFFSVLQHAQSQTQTQTVPKGITNVVLVHGAFADGSSWSRIIPLLYAKGFNVISVQNPLTSLEDDVAATKRAIARMCFLPRKPHGLPEQQ